MLSHSCIIFLVLMLSHSCTIFLILMLSNSCTILLILMLSDSCTIFLILMLSHSCTIFLILMLSDSCTTLLILMLSHRCTTLLILMLSHSCTTLLILMLFHSCTSGIVWSPPFNSTGNAFAGESLMHQNRSTKPGDFPSNVWCRTLTDGSCSTMGKPWKVSFSRMSTMWPTFSLGSSSNIGWLMNWLQCTATQLSGSKQGLKQLLVWS